VYTDTSGVLNTAFADRYHIERELGAGGMATVYLARDVKHDREVALKVLRPDLAAVVGEGTQRFLQEVRINARLDHPHILTLIDSGEAGGQLYYVLPYVQGESLRDRLDRERPLPVEDAVRMATHVLLALDYAHHRGIVHRDIKPENILLHEGEAMVADFGIALAVRESGGVRLVQSGVSAGSPQYMSPEQATGGGALDGRSDLYSLGVVLYEMLTGELPHTGSTTQALLSRMLTQRPTHPGALRDTVPPGLSAAVLKALERLPADRFASAADFVEAIKIGTAKLFEQSLDIQVVVGFDGVFREVNPALVRVLGWSAQDMTTRPFLDFVQEEDRTEALEEFGRCVAGGAVVSFENRLRHADGTTRWLQWNATPDPEARVIYATAREITDKKRVEAEMARLASIVESSDDAIIGLSPAGLIETWNTAAERMFGYRAAEAQERPISHLFPQGDSDPLVEHLNQIHRGQRVSHHDTTLRRQDGTMIKVSLTISPVRDARGTITGASLFARD